MEDEQPTTLEIMEIRKNKTDKITKKITELMTILETEFPDKIEREKEGRIILSVIRDYISLSITDNLQYYLESIRRKNGP